MVTFTKYQAIPLSRTPAKVLIRWETNLKGAELSDYEFTVECLLNGQDAHPGFQHVDIDGKPIDPVISTKTSDNIKSISPWISGLDFQWHLDYSQHLKNLAKSINYRVRCRKISTQEEVAATDMFTWDGELDLVGLYVVDEHNFLLEDVIGVPCLIYQRKRGGVACPRCFDPIQKKRLSSSCGSCYGTNWVGGFFKPIDAYVDFSPNPKLIVIEQWGEVQPNESNILMSNFPSAYPGDVIRELRTNRMWRVVQVTETEKRRVPMLQFGRVTEIKPGDIEYTIPQDERFQIKKTTELEQIKKQREF